jgi:hypothetical protein
VRIRGSLFFRDEERALKPVFGRLTELNIAPELKPLESKPSSKSEIVDRVVRRAQELQAAWRPIESENMAARNNSPSAPGIYRILKADEFH